MSFSLRDLEMEMLDLNLGVPTPYLYSQELDVDDDRINLEHQDIVRMCGVIQNAEPSARGNHLELLYDLVYAHSKDEEELMDSLLEKLTALLQEYNAHEFEDFSSSSSFSTVPEKYDDDEGYEQSRFAASHRTNSDGNYKGGDPLMQIEITIGGPHNTHTQVVVDLRDYCITEAAARRHRIKHEIFLEDLLSVAKVANFVSDKDFAIQASYMVAWFDYHIKTEDMRIRYTKILINRLEAHISKTNDLSELLVRMPEVRRLNGRTMSVRNPGGDDLLLKAHTIMLDESTLRSLEQTKDPTLVITHSWMRSIQSATICSLLLLKASSRKSTTVRAVMGSAAWTEMFGYHPWEISGMNFATFLDLDTATEAVKKIEGMIAWLTKPDITASFSTDDFAPQSWNKTSVMMTTTVCCRDETRSEVLMVLLPVSVQAIFTRSQKVTILAMFFQKHDIFCRPPTNKRILDNLQTRSFRLYNEDGNGDEIEKTKLFISNRMERYYRQRPFMYKSVLGDYRKFGQDADSNAKENGIGENAAANEPILDEWKHVPLQNIKFRLSLEIYCYLLLVNGFVVSEMGISIAPFSDNDLERGQYVELGHIAAHHKSRNERLISTIRQTLEQEAWGSSGGKGAKHGSDRQGGGSNGDSVSYTRARSPVELDYIRVMTMRRMHHELEVNLPPDARFEEYTYDGEDDDLSSVDERTPKEKEKERRRRRRYESRKKKRAQKRAEQAAALAAELAAKEDDTAQMSAAVEEKEDDVSLMALEAASFIEHVEERNNSGSHAQ